MESMSDMVENMARRARKAAARLAYVPGDTKNAALENLARSIGTGREKILAANALDVEAARGKLSTAMLERLALDDKKLADIARGVEEIAKLEDPVGKVLCATRRPNGMSIEKVSTPIGVIGIIYESRPNVTIDCAALCIKSGNAAILRGGSEAFNTNAAFASLIASSLDSAGISADSVQIVPTSDRAAFAELLKLDQYIDCIIPRGGAGLISFISQNTRIPVIKHDKGVCNVYIDKFADAELSKKLAVDAKCQRPSVCNAAENLIVHKDSAENLLPAVCAELVSRGVEIRAGAGAKGVLSRNGIPCVDASDGDFSTEYDDLIISAEIVDSLDSAIDFVNTYGSSHSDLIVTSDAGRAEKFMARVDSACVYWNVSTRFTDGFEFGFGAEIGISTNRLHARGPVGLAELCSYKYKIRGCGQTKGNLYQG